MISIVIGHLGKKVGILRKIQVGVFLVDFLVLFFFGGEVGVVGLFFFLVLCLDFCWGFFLVWWFCLLAF